MYGIKVATLEEIEVYEAVTRYKIALIRANYCNIEHTFLCKIKNKKALFFNEQFECARAYCREVVNKTPYHTSILMKIIKEQPLIIRERDRLMAMVENTSYHFRANENSRKASNF